MSDSSRGPRTLLPRRSIRLVFLLLFVLRTPYREDQLRDLIHGYRHRLAAGRVNKHNKLSFAERATKADQWLYRELIACVISAFGMGVARLITLIFRIGG